MWICLLSDTCFVSLWYIPYFTLCTPLNKVYEFNAVYCDAVKAGIVDSFIIIFLNGGEGRDFFFFKF